jgi:hypothetical protein
MTRRVEVKILQGEIIKDWSASHEAIERVECMWSREANPTRFKPVFVPNNVFRSLLMLYSASIQWLYNPTTS